MRTLTALFLLLATFCVQAFEIKPSLSGSWYNPEQDGHGFSVEVLDGDRTLLYWYVYDHDRQPIFLVAIGNNTGNKVQATVYYTDGLKFGEFNGVDKNTVQWGTLTMEFHDCNSATLKYNSNMVHSGQVFGSGTIPLQRLVSVANNKCTETVMAGVYTITGWENSKALHGLALIFDDQFITYLVHVPTDGDRGLVGLGYVTEDNSVFYLEGAEIGFDGSYVEFGGTEDLAGAYDEDGFTLWRPGKTIVGSKKRSVFMKSFDPTVLRTWEIEHLYTYDHYPNGTLTIDEDGYVTGSILNGCDVSGEIFVDNVELNQIWMIMELGDCAVAGEGRAFATYYPLADELKIIGWNSVHSFGLEGH